jgi:hypothetical protein
MGYGCESPAFPSISPGKVLPKEPEEVSSSTAASVTDEECITFPGTSLLAIT